MTWTPGTPSQLLTEGFVIDPELTPRCHGASAPGRRPHRRRAPPGRIQVSDAVAAALGDAFELEPRGTIELKGKGSTEGYFLIGRKDMTSRGATP
jgi:hypothetical protein